MTTGRSPLLRVLLVAALSALALAANWANWTPSYATIAPGGGGGGGGGSATALTLSGATLSATEGSAYQYQFGASGGTPPYSYREATESGTCGFPAGFALSSGGLLSGTAVNESGSYCFTITVTDASGSTANASYTLAIAASTSTHSLTQNVTEGSTVHSDRNVTEGADGSKRCDDD